MIADTLAPLQMTSSKSTLSLIVTDISAGAIGGGLGVMAGQPLDVLKNARDGFELIKSFTDEYYS